MQLSLDLETVNRVSFLRWDLYLPMQYIVLRHTYVLYTKLLRKGLLLEPPRSLGLSGPISPV